MTNHRANVENIANIVEYIRNADPEQFANIRDEVFEVFKEMEVDFDIINNETMDQDSDEKMLSDDTSYVSDMSEYEIDRVEKFVSEICALNARTKHCVIHNYYTTGGLTVCTACMIRIADINNVGMYHVRKHETGSFDGNVVLERVRDAIERHGSVKVNTAFIDKFATNDKCANKSDQSIRYREYISPSSAANSNKKEKHVNVLYMQDPCNDGVGHFAWIKNLSRLVLHHRIWINSTRLLFSIIVIRAITQRFDASSEKYTRCPWMVVEQWEAYRNATRCHICEKPFASDNTRVHYHCHLTGRYHGSAHANCNLNKNLLYIPIIFHNLSSYVHHVDVLQITKEKYISFTKDIDSIKNKNEKNFQKNCIKLRFIDSFKFLNASLDKLALFLSRNKLKIVLSKFSTLSNEEFELLIRKDVFPYEYVNCVEKLQDDLYLKTSFENLKTDLVIGRNAKTRIRFELFTDIDMIIFIERPGKREDKLLATLYNYNNISTFSTMFAAQRK
ncbi:hypothetical protein ALC53_10934 [Atta colombica]|uniref:C2H2-type domain-containing protein n=1 Tax=Atta colombica TaxID=520822 RepID=A0A151HZT9_9HYME|nr:hypothetical protein ALC53_10934 [Atta colombica]